jgi:ATP-binding cassette subfamily B protein RaxB
LFELLLWIGAHAVIHHEISLGMLFAFLGYKEQFSGRINMLIDRFIDFKMLSVQTERLADIVLTKPEESFAHRKHDLPDDLTVSFERVSYRYSAEDPYLLNAATLVIKPGECIAIIGPSGCGKTTCMKLLLGILQPSSGKIKLGGIDGVSLNQLGMRNYRSLIATVMQDDQLFAGSLLDNICFLEAKPDEAWMHECAKVAGVHDEILAMPMGYHTLVGDMGTILSGGQKQRVLLARALYRRPKILFLDEATSHLDVENEARIGEAIASLDITRIMIAHRPQTISIADRILSLEKGKFVEVPHKTRWPKVEGLSNDGPSNVMQFPVLTEPMAANADFVRAVAGGKIESRLEARST